MGTPAAVKVGPGLIYVAPVGTSEPASPTATLPSSWVPVGYTEAGHVFTVETTSEPVEVAEELDPIRYVNTRRTGTFDVELAEINAQNWNLVQNGGTIGTPTGGFVTFEPPDLGDEARVAVLWRGDPDNAPTEQLVIRQALATGPVAIQRRKAPQKATFAASFRMEKPVAGTKSFKAWALDTLSTDDVHS